MFRNLDEKWRPKITAELRRCGEVRFFEISPFRMEKNNRMKIVWFIVMFFNFVFGVSGVIICSLKLRHTEDQEVRSGFFKMSMAFAACNLLLSVLLLVSVLKRDQKYAFLYALLIFLSLFAATVHIESHTSHNYTYLIVFAIFAFLCFMWLSLYATYHYWIKETLSQTPAANEAVNI